MNNQNNNKNNNKTFLGIVVGVIIVVAVVLSFKASGFLEERKIQKIIQENNMAIYNEDVNNNQNTGEPTDIPPVDSNATSANTWNGNTLISLEEAKEIAIDIVGGGDIISQEEDIYDLEDTPTYNFQIKKGAKVYEIEVNALDGTVSDFDID